MSEIAPDPPYPYPPRPIIPCSTDFKAGFAACMETLGTLQDGAFQGSPEHVKAQLDSALRTAYENLPQLPEMIVTSPWCASPEQL